MCKKNSATKLIHGAHTKQYAKFKGNFTRKNNSKRYVRSNELAKSKKCVRRDLKRRENEAWVCKHSVHATANIIGTLQVLQINHKYYQRKKTKQLTTHTTQKRIERRGGLKEESQRRTLEWILHSHLGLTECSSSTWHILIFQ